MYQPAWKALASRQQTLGNTQMTTTTIENLKKQKKPVVNELYQIQKDLEDEEAEESVEEEVYDIEAFCPRRVKMLDHRAQRQRVAMGKIAMEE